MLSNRHISKKFVPFVWVVLLGVAVSGGAIAQTTFPVSDVAGFLAANTAAVAGDTIALDPGTYLLTATLTLKTGVAYQGANRDTTIIDGGNAIRIFEAVGDAVTLDSGQTGWVIENLTMTQGKATATETIENGIGGCLYLHAGAEGIVRNCAATNSLSDLGQTDGGFAGLHSNPIQDPGGMMVGRPTKLTLLNCLITNCDALDDGGAIKHEGGGGPGEVGTLLIVDGCIFTDCSSGDDGGAIGVQSSDAPVGLITNSLFINCSHGDRGTIAARHQYKVINCTFVDNTAGDNGIVYNGCANNQNAIDNSSLKVVNCLFATNTAGPGGDNIIELQRDGMPSTVTNNLFFGNLADDGVGGAPPIAEADIFHTRVGTAIGSDGNIVGDPLFVGASDFHLAAGSAAIDAGADTSADGVTADFDNTLRPQGSAYDIGAYELAAGPPPVSSGVAQWALYD